jgi:hypothetical protein
MGEEVAFCAETFVAVIVILTDFLFLVLESFRMLIISFRRSVGEWST